MVPPIIIPLGASRKEIFRAFVPVTGRTRIRHQNSVCYIRNLSSWARADLYHCQATICGPQSIRSRPLIPLLRSFGLGNEKRYLITSSDQIRRALKHTQSVEWGFVIYRCTYDDNTAWDTFLSILKQWAHENLQRENALELEKSLEWTVIEDKETLGGATVNSVRSLFKAWVDREEASKEQLAPIEDGNGTRSTCSAKSPRYLCFIHVDSQSLDSVVNQAPWPPEPDLWHIGYVNIVHVDTGISPAEVGWSNESTMENEGWTKLSADSLIPHAYACLQTPHGWYSVWTRPPSVSKILPS